MTNQEDTIIGGAGEEQVKRGNDPQKSAGIAWKDFIVYSVAVVSLLGFAVLVILLIRRAESASELEWNRSVYLLSAVEAVAFAAAGFLFGKEVHRQQAEKAEEQASNAQEQAADAKEEANQSKSEAEAIKIKAQTMKKLIDSKLKAPTRTAGGYESFGPQASAQLTQADMEELKDLVSDLFPD